MKVSIVKLRKQVILSFGPGQIAEPDVEGRQAKFIYFSGLFHHEIFSPLSINELASI